MGSFPYVMGSTANFAAKFDLSPTGALRQPAAHARTGQAEVYAEVYSPRTSDSGNGAMITAHLQNLCRLCLAKPWSGSSIRCAMTEDSLDGTCESSINLSGTTGSVV